MSEFRRWVTLLDKLVREIVLKKYSEGGYYRCYTCGKISKRIDVGHYISRAYYSHRWNLDNVRPQCRYCNYYKHGEIFKFRERLVQEIGEEKVLKMERFRNKRKPKEWQLKIIYNELVKILKET